MLNPSTTGHPLVSYPPTHPTPTPAPSVSAQVKRSIPRELIEAYEREQRRLHQESTASSSPTKPKASGRPWAAGRLDLKRPPDPQFLGGERFWTIFIDFWACYFFGWNPALFDHHIRQMLQRSSKNGIPVKEWCFLDARCRAVGAMIVCEQFCRWTKVIWTYMDI